MSELVLHDLSGGILRLALNDPATRNSLSEKMIETLQAAISGAEARVIILSAHGPAFSSGHNLKEITARRADADAHASAIEWIGASSEDLLDSALVPGTGGLGPDLSPRHRRAGRGP